MLATACATSPIAIGDGVRQLALIYPYLIRYRVAWDAVFITGVRHGARGDDEAR